MACSIMSTCRTEKEVQLATQKIWKLFSDDTDSTSSTYRWKMFLERELLYLPPLKNLVETERDKLIQNRGNKDASGALKAKREKNAKELADMKARLLTSPNHKPIIAWMRRRGKDEIEVPKELKSEDKIVYTSYAFDGAVSAVKPKKLKNNTNQDRVDRKGAPKGKKFRLQMWPGGNNFTPTIIGGYVKCKFDLVSDISDVSGGNIQDGTITFTPAFKRSIVTEYRNLVSLDPGYSQSKFIQHKQLGIKQGTLSKWIKDEGQNKKQRNEGQPPKRRKLTKEDVDNMKNKYNSHIVLLSFTYISSCVAELRRCYSSLNHYTFVGEDTEGC